MSSLRELEDYMEILVDEENEEFDMIKKKKKMLGWVGRSDLTTFYNIKLFQGQIAKNIAKKLVNELFKTIFLHDIGKEFAEELIKDLVKVSNILLENELSEKEIANQCPFKMVIKKLNRDKVANEIAKQEIAWEKLHLSLNQYVTLVYIENVYFDKIKDKFDWAEESQKTLESLDKTVRHNLTSFYNIKLDQEQLAKKIIRKLINELVKIFYLHDFGKEFAEELSKDIVKVFDKLIEKELSEKEIANQCPFKMIIKKLNRNKLANKIVQQQVSQEKAERQFFSQQKIAQKEEKEWIII